MPDATVGAAGTIVGWYGKLPSCGDFVSRGLPSSFITPWDRWLQQSLSASRDRLGEQWVATYLESPIWRFTLLPQVCGPQAYVGLLMPSVDRAGRYFPLTLAAPIAANASVLLTVTSAEHWYAQLERIALSALNLETAPESIDQQLDQWPLMQVPIGEGARADWNAAQRLAQWWAKPDGILDLTVSATHSLPAIAEFAAACLMERQGPGRSIWWLNDGSGHPLAFRCWRGLPPPDEHATMMSVLKGDSG